MAIYSTDFSEFTTGNAPTGWSTLFGAGFTALVQDSASIDNQVGTKYLDFISTSASRKAYVQGDSVTDSDTLLRLIYPAAALSTDGIRIWARTSGTGGNETGYLITISDAAIKIQKHVNGAGATTLISTALVTGATTGIVWIRFQVISTALKAKIWDGSAVEPYDWTCETTDATIASGKNGIGGYGAYTDYYCDFYECATGADVVTFPPSDWIPDTFGVVEEGTVAGMGDIVAFLGGYNNTSGLMLDGIRLLYNDPVNQMRVAVYSGGTLATSPAGATLLHDFGQTSAPGFAWYEMSCSGVIIPVGPVWIVLKSSDTKTAYIRYSSGLGNTGNYQVARGRYKQESSEIDNDITVAYPATVPSMTGSFGTYIYNTQLIVSSVTVIEPSNAAINITGYSITLDISGIISPNNSSIILTGQTALLINTIPINNASINIAGQEPTLITGPRLLLDNASITLYGQPISLIDTLPITNVAILIQGYSLHIFVYGKIPLFEIEELVPNPIPGVPHDPCGHWHLGIADEPEWDFIEQADLPIPYHEHPTKPEVCGHWHKHGVSGVIIPCIDYINSLAVDSASPIWGNYQSNEDILFIDGFIYFGRNASLYVINATTMQLVHKTIFDAADVNGIFQILMYDDQLHVLISRAGYTGQWIQKMEIRIDGVDTALIDDPLYAGQVVLGTDGNIYGAHWSINLNDFWIDQYRPVDTTYWANAWEQLPAEYSYYIYSSALALRGTVQRASGAGSIVNFQISNSGRYVINHGPTSSIGLNATTISIFYMTGLREHVLVTTNGMDEISLNENKTKYVCFGHAAYGSLRMTVGNISTGAVTQTYVGSGLLPYDDSVYHGKTIWHSNGRIYLANDPYSSDWSRIVCFSESGTVLYQYTDMGSGTNSFVILGDYIYLWAKDGLAAISGIPMPSVGRIIKLTLDLEFVCHVVTEGGGYNHSLNKYLEWPGQLTTDGNEFLFNWHKWPTESAYISRYQVTPIESDELVIGGHDPRWDFTKQNNI